MPYVSITPPPGVVKPGTVYDARGRWYDTKWVRWFEGVMQPIGGFTPVENSSGTQIDAGARVASTWGWKDNAGAHWMAWGTADDVVVYSGDTSYTITPAGMTTGNDDATTSSGLGLYNYGSYGVGVYGTGDELVDAIVPAQNYSFDNYGEDLVFIPASDNKIYLWDRTSPATVAAAITNAPTSTQAVVVTPERFIMALGADSDGRLIRWADQDDNTDWTPSSANSAGDLTLPGKGAVVAGRRSQAETLVWTETDLFSLRYIGGSFLYTANPVGSVGAVSSRCMAIVGSSAYWMGPGGFYRYNGYTEPIPSPVADWVFADINRMQISKVWAETRQDFSEITWHYPAGASVECNKSITYNYEENFWYNNTVARTAGEDRGALPYPVAFDPDGLLWRHEVGSNYGGATPYAESGPMQIGEGDSVMHFQSIIPDEKTQGEVEISIYSSFYPNAAETTNGPFTSANPTDVRFIGRQARLRIEQVTTGSSDPSKWRVGTIRADIERGGQR
jgi:hypothetical protein